MSEELNNDKQNSIEISRNLKGQYSWKIKKYFADDLDNDDVLIEIDSINTKLKNKYGDL